MERPNHKIGLVLLALVIIAAGCTDNTEENSVTVSQTSGIEITSFQATPATLSSGQSATLQMNIQNKGGVTAENIQARLASPEFGSDSGLWAVQDGVWKEGFNSLSGPNPDSNQQALTRTFQWNVDAPDKDNQIEINYGFNGEVFYKYSTQAVTEMQVVNTNAVDEQPTRSTPTIDNTGGPVQMGVQATSPIIFTEGDSEESKTPTFCVTMENNGAGTPFLYEDSKSDGNYYRGVNSDITDYIKVSVESSSNYISFNEDIGEKELIGNPPSACVEMEADYVSTNEGQVTAPITITADYGYKVEDSTSVTLKTGP